MASLQIVRYGLAVDQHNLKLLLVDPDSALEVPLAFFENLRLAIEDVGVDVVDLLPAQVAQVVLG